MPTADANVILRWLLDDAPELTPVANAVITKAPRCVVPDVALVEVVYVLERVMGVPRASVVKSIEALLGQANVDAERATWTAALADYLAHPKLSIADVFLAAEASHMGRLPFYTFDAKLARQVEAAEQPKR